MIPFDYDHALFFALALPLPMLMAAAADDDDDAGERDARLCLRLCCEEPSSVATKEVLLDPFGVDRFAEFSVFFVFRYVT